MSSDFVGADHEFHNKDFVQNWADRFVPTPERLRLFDLFYSKLTSLNSPNPKVLELGIGPGYLAHYLLEKLPKLSYCGIDFSEPMLDIAKARLKKYASTTSFIQADLVEDQWGSNFPDHVDAIISTWALHDLGNLNNIKKVYIQSFKILNKNGFMMNGDFIKPKGTQHTFEGGRVLIDEHFEMLKDLNFRNIECLSIFETELENPTPSQNYACIFATK